MRTTCRHGHPFAPENTYRTKRGHRICRTCQVAVVRRYRARILGREPYAYGPTADAILAVLRQHPDGLDGRRLRAKLGYRTGLTTVRSTISYQRRRNGFPVESVRAGLGRRYRLVVGRAERSAA